MVLFTAHHIPLGPAHPLTAVNLEGAESGGLTVVITSQYIPQAAGPFNGAGVERGGRRIMTWTHVTLCECRLTPARAAVNDDFHHK